MRRAPSGSRTAYILLACALASRALASTVRGVDPTRARAYILSSPQREADAAQKTFSCDDGGRHIAFARVNDDYCDCADGSDEPGTSACAGRGDAGFYCVNAGAAPKRVSATRVDDGVCDCCDGSDEAGKKRVVCENTCTKEARARREALMGTVSEARRGRKARATATDKSRGKRDGWKKELDALEKKQKEKQKVVDALMIEAEEAEAAERKIREAEEAERKAREAEEAAKTTAEDAAPSADASEVENGDSSSHSEEIAPTESDADAVEAEVPQDETDEERGKRIASQWISNNDATNDAVEVDSIEDKQDEPVVTSRWRLPNAVNRGIDRARRLLKPTRDATLASQAGTKRNAHDAARRELDDMNAKIEELRANIERDYGPDDALVSLLGQCFEQKIDKYKYSVCPFGEAKQDGTRLGKNTDAHIDQTTGIATLKFEGGEGCWNGPSRSLTLTLKCSDRDRLTSVEEPSRCEYVGVFHTPVACTDAVLRELERELTELESALTGAATRRDEL